MQLVEHVPISYKPYFLSDPEGAARDVIGIASHSITPFFAQRHKIIEAIGMGKEAGLKTYIRKSDVVLGVDGMPQINEKYLPLDRDVPRFVHVDLSATTDPTGIAIVKFDGHTPIVDPTHPDRFELMPKFVVEAAISIKPDSLNQIDPAEIRKWVMQLATFYKMNIACVSYDSWQSRESLMLLRAAGIPSQEISMDKTSEPYRTFRSAVYEGRVQLPDLEFLRLEMISLEYLAEKDKIDHPPKGTKDATDAVCGAILFAASRFRNIRTGNKPNREEIWPSRKTLRHGKALGRLTHRI
jgi:phage terminase large subunit-like protein